MTGGEKVLVVGALGLGVIAYLKFRSTSAAVSSPVALPSRINSQVSLAGAPPYLAPLAAPSANAVHNLNTALGLPPGLMAGWKLNPDGKTYTDGEGCKITLTKNPDGSFNGQYSRDCPNSSGIQKGISNAVTGIGKEIGGWFS